MIPSQPKKISQNLLITSHFWQSKIKKLCHPTAIRMYDDLDLNGPIGIGNSDLPFWKGFKHSFGKKDSNIDFLLKVKQKHPQKIVLVQIGEFYETWGIDSVFLVEYCGLNRMGKKGPRAGMPLINIQPVLDDLTEAGFSVVVCEQADNTKKTGRKTRFIAEVVTPSSPVYTYGLAMDRRRADTIFPDSPPEFGLVSEKRGMTLVEINPDLMTILTLEGLSEEAVVARLGSYGGRFNRIFYHENIDENFFTKAALQYENLIKVSNYLPKDFAQRMQELIQIDLSLDVETSFHQIHPLDAHKKSKKIMPRPLYLNTARQIGIIPERGIPNLIHQILPKASPASCKNLIKNLLLSPPQARVGNSLRKLIRFLLKTDISLPDFPVSNPARYIKTLQKKEASPEILKDLFMIAESFMICKATSIAPFISDGLNVTHYLLSQIVEEDILYKSSKKIRSILSPILPYEEDQPYSPQSELISYHLFLSIEDEFRGRVSPQSHPDIQKAYLKVEKTASNYEKVLQKDFLNWLKSKKEKHPGISYDLHNKSIWLRAKLTQVQAKRDGFYHPADRYGKEVKERWTTSKVEKALTQYKEAVFDAREKVSALLQEVSKELFHHSLSIVHLATFSNLMKTLFLHLKECSSKGWNIDFTKKSNSSHRLALIDFFPYWMDKNQAISNSLELHSTALLTGHNMAGKSTLIRSCAVVSLLASCGLMFPAQKVVMPEVIDGWFVRTGTHDDPEAGLSAFAVEMTDLKTALRDATEKSFILIDELGKGTESKAGHAIAGSVIEYLEYHRIRSIFATHWHELFHNKQIDLSSVQKICLETIHGKPLYRVQPGSCLSSCAFDTAYELGVDEKLINRAIEISLGYQIQSKQKSSIPKSSLPVLEKKEKDLNLPSLEGAKHILSEMVGVSLKKIRKVSPRKQASLKDTKTSSLYILKNNQGFYYVGETDNILNRITSHRSENSKKDCEFIYTTIPEGKSFSKKLETELIKKLKLFGFPLLSDQDGKNRSFGSA